MMKKLSLLLVAIIALVWINPALAQTTAYTVIANPGENASTEIRLNWHTDPGSGDSYITYTKKTDKNWKKAITVQADQALCTVFDSQLINGEIKSKITPLNLRCQFFSDYMT
jgi:hypothetical protein